NDTYILTIPSFVGKNEADVKSHTDLEITREWIYSSSTPKGRIISQTPYGGARRKVKTGSRYEVKIYVSLGDRTERIPDLSGVSVNSAAAALRALRVNVRSVAIYDGGEDGKVIYTSPPHDSEVKAGDTVTVFVSRQRPNGSVSVPDFCGLELSEAYRIALASGLYVSDSDMTDLGKIIIKQSIPAGSIVLRGSYISFITEAKDPIEREWPPIAEETDKRKDRE
ncbi:MAG: PASTA domain-containing protein, partial [Clostridia bacterium]|nr:PASTA domain-containing protein [Clostridia bacterium]